MSGLGSGPTSRSAGEGPPTAVTAPHMYEDVPEHIIWGDLEALGQSSASGSQMSSQYSSSVSRSGPASGDDRDDSHGQADDGDSGWGAIAKSSRSGKKSKQRSGGSRALDGIQFRGLTDSEAHSSRGSQSAGPFSRDGSDSEAAAAAAASSSRAAEPAPARGDANGCAPDPLGAGDAAGARPQRDEASQADSGHVPQADDGIFGWGNVVNRQPGAPADNCDSFSREPPCVPRSGPRGALPPTESAAAPQPADNLSAERACVVAERQAPGAGGEGLISAGSAGHDSGACKPCAFMHTKVGCLYGADCEFCHFRHNRKSKPRPCKGKRDRYRRIVAKMEKMLEGEVADSGDNYEEGDLDNSGGLAAQMQEDQPHPIQSWASQGQSLGKVAGPPPFF